MIHYTEKLIGIIEVMSELDIEDDGYAQVPYQHGKVVLRKEGKYWGVSVVDDGDKAEFSLFSDSKELTISQALSYIKTMLGVI